MEGKGTPKNEQNQFCHSPSVKAMTPSEVEGQDSHDKTAKRQSETEVPYSLMIPSAFPRFITLVCFLFGPWGRNHFGLRAQS